MTITARVLGLEIEVYVHEATLRLLVELRCHCFSCHKAVLLIREPQPILQLHKKVWRGVAARE